MIPKITEHSPKDLSNGERPRPSSKNIFWTSRMTRIVIFWLFLGFQNDIEKKGDFQFFWVGGGIPPNILQFFMKK